MTVLPHAVLTRRSFATGLLLGCVSSACASESNPQRRFLRVGGQLICCCGCGDALLSCNHVGCRDDARMIRELREQLSLETADVRVLQWFANKYGATVLAAPLRGGFDRLAWVVPPVLGLSGTLGVAMLLARWLRQRATTQTAFNSRTIPDELLLRVRQETLF